MREYTDDIAEMIADLPVNYVIGSTTYTGTIGTIDTGNDLAEGGFLDDIDAVLIAKKTDHSTLPGMGAQVTIGSTQYRITRITTTPADNAEVRLALQHAAQ